MTKAIKVEFLRNVSFFLYRSWVFNTEEDFQEKFKIFYRKFCVYEQAKDFIDEKLVLKKEKSVAFYTKHIFTAGHTSSQRSESLNGLIKGFGSLKKEMVQWNIYQLMTWLDRCVERIYTEMFLSIKTILNDAIKTGNFWSKWVDDIWEENCTHAVNLNSLKDLTDMNDHTFIVWDANNKSVTWKVIYFDDKPPECECGIFLSSKVSLITF